MKNHDDTEFEKRVGNLIRRARTDADLDQTTLANLSGTHQSVISELETGRTGTTLVTLRRIARGLGCELKITLERKNYETT